MGAEPLTAAQDGLDDYLMIVRENDQHLVWVGELTEAGRTVELFAKSKDELEQRARVLLNERGIEV